jgi:Nucleotidyl transferase AbiEii toxin, Type IV TA system
MLHKDPFIIKPSTFKLIQQLQALPDLKDFYLVGGTALALQLNHRNSIDIDLFTANEIQNDKIIDYVSSQISRFDVLYNFRNTVIGYVNKVKVDFITHNYPLINSPVTEEGITFLSLQDIAAMKLNAISSNSGKRLKDFIDVYYLLEHFSLNEMIEFYSIKYPKFNPLIALRAVGYFEDIDPEMDPPKLKKPLPLKKIGDRISSSILNSKRVFKS